MKEGAGEGGAGEEKRGRGWLGRGWRRRRKVRARVAREKEGVGEGCVGEGRRERGWRRRRKEAGESGAGKGDAGTVVMVGGVEEIRAENKRDFVKKVVLWLEWRRLGQCISEEDFFFPPTCAREAKFFRLYLSWRLFF